MPMLTVCNADGCPELVERGFCEAHAPARSSRSPSSSVTGTRRWRSVKATVLERDGARCQLQLPGCTGVATTADHKRPVSRGGAPYDLANLHASCEHCNRKKGASWQPST